MKLLVFRALWGMDGALHEHLARISAAGYDGVEFWRNQLTVDAAEWLRLLDEHHLQAVAAASITDAADLRAELLPLGECLRAAARRPANGAGAGKPARTSHSRARRLCRRSASARSIRA
jgi:hypothetical protein